MKKGTKHSEIVKAKISQKLKGRHLSELTKRKISKNNKSGTEESREKNRLSHLGKPSGMLGKKVSEITKRIIRESVLTRKKRLGFINSSETREKMSKGKIGNKNPQWKGGITPLRRQIQNSFKYHQWRSYIFTRDEFTCQHCWEMGVYLESHHCLKTFSQILEEYQITTLEEALKCEELLNVNNGITLCRDCHNKTKKGRGKNYEREISL